MRSQRPTGAKAFCPGLVINRTQEWTRLTTSPPKKCFCPCRANLPPSLYPGRCPGLTASDFVFLWFPSFARLPVAFHDSAMFEHTHIALAAPSVAPAGRFGCTLCVLCVSARGQHPCLCVVLPVTILTAAKHGTSVLFPLWECCLIVISVPPYNNYLTIQQMM